MNLFSINSLCFIAGLALLGRNVSASDDAATALSGDWGGLRTQWAAQGANFEAIYTGDIFSNRRGGIKRGTRTLDNIDLLLTLDGEKLFGRSGLTLFLYGLGNHGDSPSDLAGDLQGLDNIDAPTTWKLYEAWFDQRLLDDRLSLRAGLYDLNSEFDAMDSSALFINSSHGIGAEYAQTGLNGPSIFPVASLGVRLRYEPTDTLYVQAAVLDGVPGDPDDLHGTHLRLGHSDGTLLAAEAGTQSGGDDALPYTARYALGVWRYSAHFDDVLDRDSLDQPRRRDGNHGIYALTEQVVYHETDGTAQGLAVFGRYGVADADVNPLRAYAGAGLVYTGLLPGRDDDRAGLGMAWARTGTKHRRAMALADTPLESGELTLELTYRAQVSGWLTVQPDMQYIIDPGADPALDNAWMLGVRIEVVM